MPVLIRRSGSDSPAPAACRQGQHHCHPYFGKLDAFAN
ncbi:hypothetical protein THTE_0152 [Thermogutta terrifontis]|uniref:Uncharacterized protein n=1 Tax=Thermogutta terrifontis TaxID=1331910 RepID=A0A286R9V5_9BACT|nr:hypothetical protein THTE_0152 [Thermogutta terrifontis]